MTNSSDASSAPPPHASHELSVPASATADAHAVAAVADSRAADTVFATAPTVASAAATALAADEDLVAAAAAVSSALRAPGRPLVR